MPRHRWLPIGVLAILAMTLPAAASRAAAGSLFGAGGGANFSSGPGDASTSVSYGYGSVSGARASLALGALGFDDHDAGSGWGPLAAVALAPSPNWRLRGWGMRYLGSHGFRAFRLRGGPEWTLPGERTIGLFASYLDSDLGGIARSASMELGIPVHERWTANLTGGLTRSPGDVTSGQGTFGIAYAPNPRLELTAQAGLAQNGEFVLSPAGRGPGRPGGPLGDPLGLGPGSGATDGGGTRFVTSTDPTFEFGLRFTLP